MTRVFVGGDVQGRGLGQRSTLHPSLACLCEQVVAEPETSLRKNRLQRFVSLCWQDVNLRLQRTRFRVTTANLRLLRRANHRKTPSYDKSRGKTANCAH